MLDVDTAILTARQSGLARLPFAVLALGLSALDNDEPPSVGIARGQRFLASAAERSSGLAASVFTLAAGLLVAPESLGVVLAGEEDQVPTPEEMVRLLHGAADEAARLVESGRIGPAEVAHLFGETEGLAREAMEPQLGEEPRPASITHVLDLVGQLRRVSEGFQG